MEAQSPQQQTTQKPSEDEVVTVKTNLVNIDVLVKDNKGNYISDLEAEDVIVFENGVEQKLVFFDSPLSRDKGKNKRSAPKEDSNSFRASSRGIL